MKNEINQLSSKFNKELESLRVKYGKVYVFAILGLLIDLPPNPSESYLCSSHEIARIIKLLIEIQLQSQKGKKLPLPNEDLMEYFSIVED